jgi:hypothetical protein
MRAFIRPSSDNSQALGRVVDALARYAPAGVEVVDDARAADVVVLHVVGRRDRIRAAAEQFTRQGKRYAIIQYCLRSTLRPSTADWVDIWRGAALVWSYYDLPALCAEDGVCAPFEFYHAPLGVDSGVFHPMPAPDSNSRGPALRSFVICTHGPSRLTESVREAVYAARRIGERVFHLGPDLRQGPDVICRMGMDDPTLARRYSACEFVAGLRRVEGFELPAAEGLLCMTRPVMFDRPHYRQWFDGLAEFIPERPREEVVDSLEAVFLRRGARPVTQGEWIRAADRFDWRSIIGGFWERCTA